MRDLSLRGAGRYLAPGEQVRHISRRHVIVLAKPFAVWLLTLLAVFSISFLITQNSPIPVLDTAGLIVAGLASAYAGFNLLEWWRDRYVVTDQRVLLIEGIIAVRVSAVSLARVTETSYSRSIWGRLFGYGELKLDSAGEQLGLAALSYLPKPDAQYRLISSLLIRSREGGFHPNQTPVDPSQENTGPLPPVVL